MIAVQAASLLLSVVAASRALARLARWLAPAACLVPDGPRDATARDPRFHRLVRAAAALGSETSCGCSLISLRIAAGGAIF